MNFIPTLVSGAWLISLEPRVDSRGQFARAFCSREFQEVGLNFQIVQSNLVATKSAGTLRGLHFQVPPATEQKLVRCTAGAVLDVIVDARPDSPTFRSVYSVRLDATNRHSLFVPAGVAHGYQSLVDDTDFLYLTDRHYAPECERGVRYSDPLLSEMWPLPARNVSPRDELWPDLT